MLLTWLRPDRDVLFAILVAPALLFPVQAPLLACVALLVLAARELAQRSLGYSGPRTPFDWPWAAFGLGVLLGAFVSPAPYVTITRFCGVLLGMYTFRALLRVPSGGAPLALLLKAFLAIGVLAALLGAWGTAWLTAKFDAVEMLRHWVPRGPRGIPGAEQGINPNALGGTMLFFLPLALSLLVDAPRLVSRRVAATATLACAAALMLSQSRSAWIAMLVASAGMACVRWRRLRLVVGLAGGAAAAGAYLTCFQELGPCGFSIPGDPAEQVPFGHLRLQGRIEVWSRAVRLIEEVPFTGIGLNAFREAVVAEAPLVWQPAGADVAHAHDIFLQVALDLGIAGLIGYVSLLAVALYVCASLAQSGPAPLGSPALGIFGGLIAVHVFGLTDAIPLGSKVGLFLWAGYGLAGALWNTAQRNVWHESPRT